jgi:hypothetical protein
MHWYVKDPVTEILIRVSWFGRGVRVWHINLNVCVIRGNVGDYKKKNTLPSHVRVLDTTHQMFHLSIQEFTELERQSNSWNDLVMQHLTSIGGTRTHAPMCEGSEADEATDASETSAADEPPPAELANIGNSLSDGHSRKRSREEACIVPPGMRHALKPLRNMPGRENMADPRVRCALCTEKGSVYCLECTKVGGRGIYALCCPSSGRVCVCQHWCDMVTGTVA